MKIRHSLFAKLSLGLLALLVSIGLIYAVLSTIVAKSYFERVSQDLHRSLADNLVADKNLVQEGRLNEEALKETFRQYMVVNPSIEIYLLDLQGKIIAYSADPGKVKREKVSLRPVFSFLDGSEQYPLGDDPRSHDKRKPFSVTEVPTADNPEGYLYVVLRGEQQDQIEEMAQESHFIRFSGWAVLFSLFVGLVAGLLVFYFLTRRLSAFSRQIEHFERSGFTSDLISSPRSGNDEIDQINRTFENMAARIRTQLEQLEAKDTQRRHLVAQISHDLRTPLASMLGYIESLELKKEGLSIKQQTFLEVAHKQGRRLSQMIEALFELSSLEAQETEPTIEAFMPAEWLYDVAQKHQIRAQDQGVTVEVDIQQEGLLAKADISLLERVMDNLISNALSHAQAQSNLTLRLNAAEEQIKIEVVDQGKGIAQEELDNLFEPFVSSEGRSSWSAECRHAGLGLAIAKRIMLILNGDIAVNSQQNVGSTFVLSLPKV